MLVTTLRGHQKEISDLDVNYENTLLASAGYDKKIRIWNLKTIENTEVLLEHIHVISCVKVGFCRHVLFSQSFEIKKRRNSKSR